MKRHKATVAYPSGAGWRIGFTLISVAIAVVFGLGVCWMRGYPGNALGDARMAPYWVAIYVLRAWDSSRWTPVGGRS